MSAVSTCLWFDTQAKDAARLYTSLLPNSEIRHVERYPEGVRDREPGSVMVVDFTLEGVPYQALNGGPDFAFTPAASIVVTTDTDAETDRLWDALTDGGQESMCGWLVDRYGLSWQIVPRAYLALMASLDDDGRARAASALMKQRKIDVDALRAAAEG